MWEGRGGGGGVGGGGWGVGGGGWGGVGGWGCFFFNDTATTEIYTLSLHDALPISLNLPHCIGSVRGWAKRVFVVDSGSTDGTVEIAKELGAERSEEHTSELQSPVPISYAVFCLKKKKYNIS